MLIELALPRIEKLLNTYIKLDPFTFKKLTEISGKNVGISITGIPETIYIKITANGLILTTDIPLIADTHIFGAPFTLLRLLKQASSNELVAKGDIKIQGDLELAQQLQLLFKNMDIDWEEYLSHFTGDISAHQIGLMAKQLSRRANQTLRVSSQNLTEYIQEELRILPPQAEIADFISDVDELRSAVDRLAARVNNLERENM